MGYYSSGIGMRDLDSGFAKAQADYDAMEPPEPKFVAETVVLRAVVYLTYVPTGEEVDEDDAIEGVQSPYEAGKSIKRALDGMSRQQGTSATFGLEYRPDRVEVVDAEYMSPEEADNHA